MKRYIALILSLTLILLSFNAYSSNITELKLIVEDSFNGTEGEWVSGWSFSTKPSSGIKHSYAKDPEDSNESVMMLKRDEKLDANGNPANGTRVKMYRYISGSQSKAISKDVVITYRIYNATEKSQPQLVLRDCTGSTEGNSILTINMPTSTFAVGKWYDVRIEVSNNGSSGVVNAWATDGITTTTLKEDAAITFATTVSDQVGLCRVDIESRYARNMYGISYIDDFKVYEDYRDELKDVADSLRFDLISNEQLQTNVKETLDFITELTYNNGTYEVEWSSSNEEVIKISDGSVSRFSFANEVTLTAKIYKDKAAGVYTEKAFVVTVPAHEGATDDTKLSEYAQMFLSESKFTYEETTKITKSLSELPTTGPEGITVAWLSNSDYMDADGTVTRPEFGVGDQQVELTATITTVNGTQLVKTLYFTVLEKPDPYLLINATLSNLTYEALTDEDSASVTKDLLLPTVGEGGLTISWSGGRTQEDTVVIATEGESIGKITRSDTKQTVTITATAANDGFSSSKDFTFTVFPTPHKMIEADMQEILLTDGMEVKESFDLIELGSKYKTKFTWESSDDTLIEIIGARAVVYRPNSADGNKSVQLILTAECEDITPEFVYNITVLADVSDSDMVAEAIAELTYDKLSVESKESITQNLALPNIAGNGVTVEWASDNAAITNKGKVTRPLPGEDSVTVNLTATFTKNYTSVTPEPYVFTVIPFEDGAEVLSAASDTLTFSTLSTEEIDAVTTDLTVPTQWKYDTTIEWTSNSANLEISGETGKVTRPEWGKTSATTTLTAKIFYGEQSVSKNFVIKILEKNYMETENVLWSENFEGWTTDNMYKTEGGSWTRPAEVQATLSLASDPLDAENQVLAIDRTVNKESSGYVLAKASSAKGGIVTMGIDVYLPANANVKVAGMSPDREQVPVWLYGAENNPRVTATGYSLPEAEVKINDWNSLVFEINVDKQMYHVYVNGKLCTEDGKVTDSAGEVVETPYGVHYYYDDEDDSGAKTIQHFRLFFPKNHVTYIDNLYMKNKIVYTQEQLSLADAWEQEFLSENNIYALVTDLVLPSISKTGISINYSSSDSNALDRGGKLTLAVGSADVVFTVKFNNGHSIYYKYYDIHVIKTEEASLSDEEIAKKDLEEVVNTIKANYMLSDLKSDIDLPAAGQNGSTISAVSSDTTALSNTGKVTVGTNTQTLTFTVTALKNGRSSSEVLTITVGKKETTPTVTTPSSSGGAGGGIKVVKGEQTVPNSGIEISQPENPSANESNFSDLPKEHWAYSKLQFMVEKGIMSGTGSGKIEPDRTIRREEFIKMLCVALDLPVAGGNSEFSDVDSESWYAPYITAAKNAGFITGYEDGRAGIGEVITRQDMAVMICRSASLADDISGEVFSDDSNISAYAKNPVYTLKNIGVISGRGDGIFDPTAGATRAETASMLYTAINKNLFGQEIINE